MAAEFFNNLKLFLYIQKSNVKTAFLNKADALINVLMMLINNLAFFFMWWVIFQHKGTINGWGIGEMALLYMAINNAFASFALFARGIQALPEYIDNGTLDNYLATPRNPLFMISTSESTFANWGDFLTGLLAFFWSGYLSWTTFFIMLFGQLFCLCHPLCLPAHNVVAGLLRLRQSAPRRQRIHGFCDFRLPAGFYLHRLV